MQQMKQMSEQLKQMSKKVKELREEVKELKETPKTRQMEFFKSGAIRENKIGKGRYDLISPLAIERLARVLEQGAMSHGERNWERGLPMTRTLDSALRHINKYMSGEIIDRDSGLPTLSHALVNLVFANHFEEGILRGLYEPEDILQGISWFDMLPLIVRDEDE